MFDRKKLARLEQRLEACAERVDASWKSIQELNEVWSELTEFRDTLAAIKAAVETLEADVAALQVNQIPWDPGNAWPRLPFSEE